MPLRVGTPDVEPVRLGERLGVAVRRGQQSQDRRTRGRFEVADPQPAAHPPPGHLYRRVVAQRLLDRTRGQPRVGAQRRELLGMAQQRQNPVADQVDRGLVAGDQQQDAGGQQLLLGELVAVLLDADQMGQQVRTGRGAPPGDQLPEVRGELVARLGRILDRPAQQRRGVHPQGKPCRPALEPFPVGQRYAEQLADHAYRQRVGQAADHVERVPDAAEQLVDDLVDVVLEAGHDPRGERRRDQPPQPGVVGRVAEQE
jgi:hypothetical protein